MIRVSLKYTQLFTVTMPDLIRPESILLAKHPIIKVEAESPVPSMLWNHQGPISPTLHVWVWLCDT